MRFLVDAQLPPALAQWLWARGCAPTAVRDVGLLQSDDGSIRNCARAGGCGLITKDDDFVERFLDSDEGPSIVWLRIGNCTKRALFGWLELLWPETLKRLEQGERLIELRT